jgi:hypothetical protein
VVPSEVEEVTDLLVRGVQVAQEMLLTANATVDAATLAVEVHSAKAVQWKVEMNASRDCMAMETNVAAMNAEEVMEEGSLELVAAGVEKARQPFASYRSEVPV